MAQRMLDEKSRVSEPQDDDVSDAETLGSRDTNDLSDVSEEEEEEELFDQKENVPPPRRERRKIPQLQDESSTEPNTAKKAKRVPKRRANPLPSSLPKNTGAKSVHVREEPVPQHIADMRSEILEILLEIESFARRHPDRRISIRNRTRESITRKLHYENDEDKLTRMKADANKLLSLWQTV
ncbi:33K [turkey adenovirus 5]|uniref:33K n=1 Tax=turkey adenovirus 5 TaxID=1408258 RepID=U5NHM7_9ADEN|nr:33K [Turkey aviadenovirus 5]AGX93346.1 33K [Turkey aviadenovirus 5]AGX93383.1 33K [Turkey aviadenovirus 5]